MNGMRDKGINLSLWVGILLPPLAWSAALEAVYLTNGYACAGSAIGWSHLSSVIGLVLCLAGGLIAWNQLPSGNVDTLQGRGKFMAQLGIFLAVLFALLTIAQWLPVIVGVPCGK